MSMWEAPTSYMWQSNYILYNKCRLPGPGKLLTKQAKASGIFALAVINWEELVLGFVKASELLAVQDERNRGPGMRWTAYGMLPA